MTTLTKRNNQKFEYKAMQLSVKDVDTKSGIVTGYYAAFGNIDNGYDRILKGAFTKTILERGPEGTKQIKHLYQHDSWTPLGLPTILKEDTKGLYFETPFSKTEFAQDILIQYAEGIFNEHSIGYRVIKEKRVEDDNGNFICWDLEEVKLWEGSTVTWGMNPNTPFTGLKSETKEDHVDELSKRMQKCISVLKIGSLSDETLERAEIELLKINEAYKSLLTQEPDKSTQEPRIDKLKRLNEILTIK